MSMTPQYQILAGGVDVTSNLSPRMTRLSVTDADGVQSDSVRIQLDDGDFALSPPATGTLLAVWMGYAETGLDLMGLFTVNRVRRAFDKQAGAVMGIEGKSADLKKEMKAQRTGQYENKTIAQIVSEVAGRHGLGSKVSSSLSGISYDWLGQAEESDLHLITRVARDHDAICKVAGGKILMLARGETGLPAVTLTLTDFISCEVETEERAEHGKAVAHWHDRAKAQRVPEEATSGEGPPFTMRHIFRTKEDAKAAAAGKQKALDRQRKRLSGTISGNTGVMGGAPLVITEIAALYDGAYNIKTVEHAMEKQAGYTSRIEAETEE